MSKRLLLLCAAVLMMSAFTGAAMAADAVTVYVEPASKDVVLYQGGQIQARAVFLDAAGQVATTYGGAQIGDSVLELKSANYAPAVTFDPGSPVNIDNSGVREFTITYNPAVITELGDDIITATLKKGSTSISNVIPVKLLAPQANTYAVRTGLSSVLLPEVLEALPAPQNNNNAILSAGSSVTVTVLAAFGRDTVDNGTGLPPQDGNFDTFIFTDNVPVGGENVNLTGQDSDLGGSPITIVQTSATLTNGVASVDVTLKDLKIPDLLKSIGSANFENSYMNVFLDPTYGVNINWSALGTITREVGNGYSPFANVNSRDVNADDQVIINPRFASLGFANSFGVIALSDNSLHKPAPVKYVTIIGLPVNGTDGLANQGYYGNSTQIAASDAYNLLLDPKQKPGTFLVNAAAGLPPTAQICGAIVGFDQFNNPAPFLTDGTIPQFTLSKNDGAGTPEPIDTGIAFNNLTWYDDAFTDPPVETSIPVAGVLAATVPYTAFMPFQIAFNGTAATDVHISASNLSSATVYENVDALSEGVTFNAAPNVTGVTFNPATPDGFTVADDDQTITVNGTADESSFVLRAKNKKGVTVKLNTKGQTTAKDNVNIPRDGSTTNAEEDVIYFTKVNGLSASEKVIFYLFEGKSNKTLVTKRVVLAGSGILPADPGDFPPSGIGNLLSEIKAVIDTDHNEINLDNSPPNLPIPTFIIIDAFGNSYTGNAVMEDADPTVEVFKADGTTPYPGAKGEVDQDNLIVSFNLDDITSDSGDAKVKVAAGAGSASVTYKVRALKQTSLKSVFIPLMGNDGQAVETPVKLNFADQSGMLIAPVVNYAVPAPGYVPGSYEVDLEAADGTTSEGDEFLKTLSTDAPSVTFTATLNDGDADKIMTISADGGDADAGETTLTLDFNADFEKPAIGALTASDCAISIAITDNKAVNLAGSTVVVKNGATGEDVTSTLKRTDTNDGTAAGSIDFKEVPVGSYVLEIVAKDKANNETAPTTRTSDVTVCSGVGPSCVSVDPTFGVKDTTLDVVIKAERSTFGPTSAVTFSCTGITVNSATANSATEITANITIAADAVDATCDATVTTGAETVVCTGGFGIKTQLPSCASVSPASVDAGFTGDVTVTLADIDLTGASNIAVAFGCSGVTVNSATANSATTVVANITVAEDATGGACSVTVTGGATGSVGIICANALTVVPEPPCAITVSPSTVQTGIIFGRRHTITVTAGEGCDFDATTTVTFDGNVTLVGDPVISGSTITAEIRTNPVILFGKGENTLTVTTGDETATATLTVTGLFF